MKSNKLTPKKNAAQAIVEFAIVLPLLLLLLYGLLEVGRLLFIYSSVVTATRQAARYGATSGMGGDWTSVGGPNNSGIPRYRDCFGIRQAAQKANFLRAFTNADIVIYHDTGSGTPTSYCTGTSDAGYTPATSTTNPDRIGIQITGHFTTVVPKLIPSFNRNVNATSYRTILPAVTIDVTPSGGGGGGGGPATTTVTVTSSAGTSEPGQIVTFTATVTSGSGTPTGTVTFTYSYNGGSEMSLGSCTNLTLSSGAITCDILFSDAGSYVIKATYTPDDAAVFSAGTGQLTYPVGPANTITAITSVVSEPSLINNAVTVSVWVYNQYGGTSPAGTVAVSASSGSCTVTLSGGIGSCVLPGFSNTGWYNIGAAYTPADATKHKPSTATAYSHEVLASPPTASNTPVPPTPITPVATTPAPTPVTGCNSIAQKVSAISFDDTTMSVTLQNNNQYPVTIGSIFVAWNYTAGHDSGDTRLWLRQAQLGSTIFWTGNLNQPGAVLPLSTSVVIDKQSKPTLTFTFDKSYDIESGEQIQIQFSTPGCESYPVILPSGSPTITPAPTGNLKLQLISGGSDNTQESQFRYRIQNNDATSASNLSVRLYFTLDGSNAATDYVLVSYHDGSGAATITGPTSVSSSVYYFTVNYGTAALAAGASWEFQGSLHLGGWGPTYIGANDWWHTPNPLPVSWTDWTTIPVYVNGLRTWGSQP